MKEFVTVFITMFLSEVADKTQFALISFATKSSNLLRVWFAATLAFCVTNFIAVILGAQVNKIFLPSITNYLSGTIFILIGIYTILSK